MSRELGEEGVHTELFSPISQIIHPQHLVSIRLIQIGQKRSNDGTPQMSRMERFRNVGTREFNDNLLLLAEFVRTVTVLLQEG